jgi:hypothetical protein
VSGGLLRDLGPARIDYQRVLDGASSRSLEGLLAYLPGELPQVWLEAYVSMMPHRHNVHEITVAGFDYLWDRSGELVAQGKVLATEAVDDRLVAAHGRSRVQITRRDGSRLKGRTLGAVTTMDRSERSAYDRGHAVGHALGGVLDLNIIPQIRAVNRGGLWREMERHCQREPGTYLFCRPLYAGLSSHPAEIEFGLLRRDGSLWVETFKNYGRKEELEQIERLYRRKIGAVSGE